MLTPTPATPANSATTPDNPATRTAALEALTRELRAFYTEHFRLALHAAQTNWDRFETPDGTSGIDPVYAADTAACRAVNQHLPVAMARWLPAAECVDRIDEPAVIDSHWLHQDQVLVVEWDYTHDFGDPNGLRIWEAAR